MHRNFDRTLWVAAALVAALVPAVSAGAQERPKPKKPLKPVNVQLVGINDFHGHLESSTSGSIARSGEALPAGGVQYLATHIRALERRRRHTLVVAAGDLVGGSPLLSSLFHDEPAIEAMNGIGMDVSAVGNHEFDEGTFELRRLQRGGCHPDDGCEDGTPYEGARFPFLAANVVSRRTGKPLFPPYAIRRVGPVKIGFIGMTLEGTPGFVSPRTSRYHRFLDEAATANRYARELKRRGVRAIVVLLHEGGLPRRRAGYDECPRLSGPLREIVFRTTRDVDAFMTGHTHAAYNCTMWGRPVTSAGSYGRLITRLRLELDRRTGEVRRAEARNRIVGHWVMQAPDMSELIAHYRTFAGPLGDRLIGRLARSASRSRDDSRESTMGNLVADAQAAAGGGEAAFTSFGHIRAGLAAGSVSYARAFQAQPFGLNVVSMTMTGAQILDLLKEQWCGQPSQQVLQVSAEVSYTWSAGAAEAIVGTPCATAPNPVSALTIGGKPVNPARAYRITVSSGMAGRSDRFPTLQRGTAVADGPDDTEALERHIAPSLDGEPLEPPLTDRITRVP